MSNIFQVPSVYPFWWSVCLSLLPAFKIGLFAFLLLSFEEFLYLLGISFFIRYVVWKYLLPLCSLTFYSFNSVFQKAKVLNFDQVYWSVLSFMDCGFAVISMNSLPNPRPWRISPMFSSKSFTVLWDLQ